MPDPNGLFTPLVIGGYCLPSRVFLAPINTGFATRGRPTTRLVSFHRRRSGPAIGISMVGNVVPSITLAPNAGTLVLHSSEDLPTFRVLARAIMHRGSLPGIQLSICPVDLYPSPKWLSRNMDLEQRRLRRLVSDLTLSFLVQALDSLLSTGRLAASAGFAVIQLHAAHGYLLSLLLNPLTNGRTDDFRYDGPWLYGFFESFLNAVSPRLVSVRLSLFSGLRQDRSEEIAFIRYVSEMLAEFGAAILDYSAGFYTVDKRLIYPNSTPKSTDCPYYEMAHTLASRLTCLVSFAGNVNDLRQVPTLLHNMAVSVGRAFISDPDFAEKSKAGRFDLIRFCQRSGRCHYFSRGSKLALECGVNHEFLEN